MISFLSLTSKIVSKIVGPSSSEVRMEVNDGRPHKEMEAPLNGNSGAVVSSEGIHKYYNYEGHIFVDSNNIRHCGCNSCDWILKLTFCTICSETLQGARPCMCQACGSLWCFSCHKKIKRCCTCKKSFKRVEPSAPCATMMRLIDDLQLPCRYYEFGCIMLLTQSQRPSHEKTCEYNGEYSSSSSTDDDDDYESESEDLDSD